MPIKPMVHSEQLLESLKTSTKQKYQDINKEAASKVSTAIKNNSTKVVS